MDKYEQIKPRARSKVTHGITVRVKTGCGKMYVIVNEDEKGPCEVFTQLGKSGGCTGSQAEAVSRMISLALRSGISIDEIQGQLKGIRCPSPEGEGNERVLSCADGIASALREYMQSNHIPIETSQVIAYQPMTTETIADMSGKEKDLIKLNT
jgi:ribonucleoside-diphosphate reductase alpha chain